MKRIYIAPEVELVDLLSMQRIALNPEQREAQTDQGGGGLGGSENLSDLGGDLS